jgi:hypothetical protein
MALVTERSMALVTERSMALVTERIRCSPACSPNQTSNWEFGMTSLT